MTDQPSPLYLPEPDPAPSASPRAYQTIPQQRDSGFGHSHPHSHTQAHSHSHSQARFPSKSQISWLAWSTLILFALPLVGLVALLHGFEGDYVPRLWHRLTTKYAWDTLGLALGTGIGAGLVGTLVAVGLTSLHFPAKRLVFFLSFLPIAMPSYLVAYVYGEALSFAGPLQTWLRDLFGWQSARDYWFPDVKSLGGGIYIFSLTLYPYALVAVSTALRHQLSLIAEVARTSGRGLFYAVIHVAVPLVWPAAFAGMLLASLEAVGDFGLVEYFGIDTFTFALFDMWQNKGKLWAAALISLLLLSLVSGVVWLEARMRQRTHRMSSNRFSRPPAIKKIEGWRGWAIALALLVPSGLGFLFPALTLLGAMLTAVVTGSTVIPWDEIRMTGYIGTFAAFLLPAFVIFLQWQQIRIGRQARSFEFAPKAVNLILPLGYAIPGLVMALSVGWLFRHVDLLSLPLQRFFGLVPMPILGTTIVMLTFAYALRFAAPASAAVRPGMMRMTPSILAASHIMGKGRWQRLIKVYAPMLAAPFCLSALVVFVEVTTELPIMLFLRDANVNTLAALAYDFGSEGLISQAAPAALLILLLGTIPAALIAINQHSKA